VDGDPADHVGAVDDGDPAAELGRGYGGLLATRAGSDDKHVEVGHPPESVSPKASSERVNRQASAPPDTGELLTGPHELRHNPV
jgi:hypothetical protein